MFPFRFVGPVDSMSADGVTLTTQGGQQGMRGWKSNADGAALLVINGTGAGQYVIFLLFSILFQKVKSI
jgi:hypothetical protein